MIGRVPAASLLGFEVFGIAVGLAVVCAVLSLVLPMFVAPTATLAALAIAGWVSRSRQRGTLSRKGIGVACAAALGALAGATVGFLDPPPALLPVRGMILAGGLLPLFVVERFRFSHRAPVFDSP